MIKMRISAGTIITVLLALAIGGYGVYQQHRGAMQPPVVERTIQGSTSAGISPVPEFLLRHRQELALSAAQVQRLHGVALAYRHESAPIQRRMNVAAAGYQQTMDRSPQDARHNLPELQQSGSEVQHLSSVAVLTRQSYWQQARAVLTRRQQTVLDHLLTRATLQDLE